MRRTAFTLSLGAVFLALLAAAPRDGRLRLIVALKGDWRRGGT